MEGLALTIRAEEGPQKDRHGGFPKKKLGDILMVTYWRE
jgi:hypothetical protein